MKFIRKLEDTCFIEISKKIKEIIARCSFYRCLAETYSADKDLFMFNYFSLFLNLKDVLYVIGLPNR